MTPGQINTLVHKIINDKDLVKKYKIDKRDVYDLKNEENRKVHLRKKLFILYQCDLLILNEDKIQSPKKLNPPFELNEVDKHLLKAERNSERASPEVLQETIKTLYDGATQPKNKSSEFLHGKSCGLIEAYSHAWTIVKRLPLHK